jgi:hypothetical protein
MREARRSTKVQVIALFMPQGYQQDKAEARIDSTAYL